MATADGYALPNPTIPKTLGILNVIFAVLLILFGLCSGFGTLAAPFLVQVTQKAQQDARAKVEAARQDQLKTLDERAQAAPTDEEKAAIAKERETVASSIAPEPVNPASAGLDALKDPRVMGYTVANLASGVILHILLLVAGIGLIRLTPWGRTLGVWWAGLQILQLVILGAVNFALIIPIQREANEKQLVELRERAAAPNAPPDAAMVLQMTETMTKLTPVVTGAYLVAGIVYPIICLVLLQGAGARAACVGRSPARPPTTGFDPA